MIDWSGSYLDEISTFDMYRILKARQDVFVVEQNCVYQDMDSIDQYAWHLCAWQKKSRESELEKAEKTLMAYLRVVFPGHKYAEPSIGRVLTTQEARGTGLGKQLLEKALLYIDQKYPHQHVRISAQSHLHQFYAAFGFVSVSEPYDEDGIPHVEMLRRAPGLVGQQ